MQLMEFSYICRGFIINPVGSGVYKASYNICKLYTPTKFHLVPFKKIIHICNFYTKYITT